MQRTEGEPLVIPVVEENVQLERRWVDTGRGVRVEKKVTEREEPLDELLTREELSVERVAIDRLVEGAPPTQHLEGDTLVVPVLEEVLVVERKLKLKEEVRITRRRHLVHAPQRVKLKSEEVSVERFDEGGEKGEGHG